MQFFAQQAATHGRVPRASSTDAIFHFGEYLKCHLYAFELVPAEIEGAIHNSILISVFKEAPTNRPTITYDCKDLLTTVILAI